MFGLFTKRKKEGVGKIGISHTVELDKEPFEQWRDSLNVGKLHTNHTPIEDSSLVEGTPDALTQLKIKAIKTAQSKFEEAY